MKKLMCVVLAGLLLLGFCTGCNQTKLTRAEITAIVKETYERYGENYSYFLFPCTEMSVNLARTLPNDANMLLVTDERFENIQAVRDFFATFVTDEFIQKHHPHVFYDAYLPDEPKDVTNENYTIYYEQDGRLYANQNPMLIPPGDNADTNWDRATVISQTTQEIVAEYPSILTVYPDKYSAAFEQYGTVRYVIKKVNDAWVLDDVIETPAPAFTTTIETTAVTTAATIPSTEQTVSDKDLINSISSLSMQEVYDHALKQYEKDPNTHRNIGELQPETEQIIVMDGKYYQSCVSSKVDIRYVFISKSEAPTIERDFLWDWVAVGTKDVYSLEQLGKINADDGR